MAINCDDFVHYCDSCYSCYSCCSGFGGVLFDDCSPTTTTMTTTVTALLQTRWFGFLG
jgi:hypothetical protein